MIFNIVGKGLPHGSSLVRRFKYSISNFGRAGFGVSSRGSAVTDTLGAFTGVADSAA